MKKNLFISKIILIGFLIFVFSVGSVFAQTKTIFDFTKTYFKEVKINPGTVDFYEMWLGAGHLYNFTAGTNAMFDDTVEINCKWGQGNDLILGFLFPQRKQSFFIDAQQNLGAEFFTFTSKFDEPVYVIVVPDTQRCKKYQIQLSTTDPSVLTMPNSRRISSQEYINAVKNGGYTQVTPPVPDQNVSFFENRFPKEKKLFEETRSSLQKLEKGPYSKSLIFNVGDNEFPYDIAIKDLNELGFLLRRTDRYTLGRQIKEEDIEKKVKEKLEAVRNLVGGFGLQINLPRSSPEGNFVKLVDLPKTIQVYRQSLVKWRNEMGTGGGSPVPRLSRQYEQELDSITTFYNQNFPKQVSRLETLMKSIDRTNHGDGYGRVVNWLDSNGLVTYAQIYQRLEKIKNGGAGLGFRLECKVYKAGTNLSGERIDSPICDFGLRLTDPIFVPRKFNLDNYVVNK